MILKHFYNEKLTALKKELSTVIDSPIIHLYSEEIFNRTINTPIFMFKYDTIKWESSSEKTYKADVNFSLSIVLPKASATTTISNSIENYEVAFDYAQKIDTAILTKSHANKFIDTHSTFKQAEKQQINNGLTHRKKDNYFIWEITYKTTLIENSLKRKYVLLQNGVAQSNIDELGYEPEDFIGINSDKKIKHTLEINTKTTEQP